MAVHSFAAFGLISAVIQFYSAVWVPGHAVAQPLRFALLAAIISLVYGVLRSWPKRSVRRDFGRPEMSVSVVVGDLLERKGQIVVGFSDTFDTELTNGVIDSASLQGQLLARVYHDDIAKLDQDIQSSLVDKKPIGSEARTAKAHGKLDRYAIGTVAVLETDSNRIYGVAYSEMSNDLVAKSNVHHLWHSLGQLWDAVYKHGQRAPVMMPLVGSELARINCLDRESLLKMSLLSFVSRSREELICKEFTIVVHPKDHVKINMLEIEAFLKSL